jgi:hypothetical protein
MWADARLRANDHPEGVDDEPPEAENVAACQEHSTNNATFAKRPSKFFVNAICYWG